MQDIISWLLVLIQYQHQIINCLCILVFGNAFKPKPEKCTDKKYIKLSVDPLPLFGKPRINKIYNCNEIIAKNNIKPVKSRGGKTVPVDAICPYCGATHEYIYDNIGGRGQFWCKVCNSKFNPQKPSKLMKPTAHFVIPSLI